MIEVDGSIGEGGGQILRTSIALSAVKCLPVRIENIRAKRENPGIRPQHLQAVEALKRLCNAEVKGAHVGSTTLEFMPKRITGGKLRLDVGTAGSITLVLQAIMIAATKAEKKVEIELVGGTDVLWSPSIDYLRYVTLPLLKKFGYNAEINLIRRGYYPRGGGEVEAVIEPHNIKKITLSERGPIDRINGISHADITLKNAAVAERQKKASRNLTYNRLIHEEPQIEIDIKEEYNQTLCPGSGITIWAETKNSILGADTLGEKGRPSEYVGREAAEALIKELESNAALDSHMADQIIPYLALAGGEVHVSELTEHAKTNAEIIRIFGYDIEIKDNIIKA